MKAKIRRHLYAHHCARKVVYRNLADAEQAAARRDDRLEAYRCPVGPHYHVGHSPLALYVRHPAPPAPHIEDLAA